MDAMSAAIESEDLHHASVMVNAAAAAVEPELEVAAEVEDDEVDDVLAESEPQPVRAPVSRVSAAAAALSRERVVECMGCLSRRGMDEGCAQGAAGRTTIGAEASGAGSGVATRRGSRGAPDAA
ncbi:MAG: hypothetical protein IPH03_06535 [Tetrasphaera sp.]|nr:hypothetical protein [Tetrasphaera sp.]